MAEKEGTGRLLYRRSYPFPVSKRERQPGSQGTSIAWPYDHSERTSGFSHGSFAPEHLGMDARLSASRPTHERIEPRGGHPFRSATMQIDAPRLRGRTYQPFGIGSPVDEADHTFGDDHELDLRSNRRADFGVRNPTQ